MGAQRAACMPLGSPCVAGVRKAMMMWQRRPLATLTRGRLLTSPYVCVCVSYSGEQRPRCGFGESACATSSTGGQLQAPYHVCVCVRVCVRSWVGEWVVCILGAGTCVLTFATVHAPLPATPLQPPPAPRCAPSPSSRRIRLGWRAPSPSPWLARPPMACAGEQWSMARRHVWGHRFLHGWDGALTTAS